MILGSAHSARASSGESVGKGQEKRGRLGVESGEERGSVRKNGANSNGWERDSKVGASDRAVGASDRAAIVKSATNC